MLTLIILFEVALVVFTIFIVNKFTSHKKNRILSSLDGEIGAQLKKRLPSNAKVYTADTNAITWKELHGGDYIIWYAELGFSNLPRGYEYVVCHWMKDNIVSDKENYHFESMTYHENTYESSDSMTIEKDYAGNYKAKIDPGKYVSTDVTIGHALVRNGYDFEGHRVNQTPLKKW